MIKFSVLGHAVAKGRPRLGRSGVYTPEETRRYEEIVRAAAVVAMGNKGPLTGPVILRVTEYREMPKAWSKKKRAEMDWHPCETKPDVSNLAKGIEDALNEVCYLDDSQVAQLVATKVFTPGDPRVDIEIAPWQ